jgi:hypothetical protein
MASANRPAIIAILVVIALVAVAPAVFLNPGNWAPY